MSEHLKMEICNAKKEPMTFFRALCCKQYTGANCLQEFLFWALSCTDDERLFERNVLYPEFCELRKALVAKLQLEFCLNLDSMISISERNSGK